MNEQKKAEFQIEQAGQSNEAYAIFRGLILEKDMIAGKNIQDWKIHFRLKIPDAPDAEQCKQLDMELAKLYHDATFYLTLAQSCLNAATYSSESQYYEKFQAIVRKCKTENTKLPAAATLETLTKADLQDIESFKYLAKKELDFWKRVISGLDSQRKLINDATINNCTQVKLEAPLAQQADL